MVERYPPNSHNLLPMSYLIWNAQGAGSRAFIAAMKKLIKRNKPYVQALVETHMSGKQAKRITKILGYSCHTRTDAVGFSGGIWIYWKHELVSVESIVKNEQFITMNITRVGETPWYFTPSGFMEGIEVLCFG